MDPGVCAGGAHAAEQLPARSEQEAATEVSEPERSEQGFEQRSGSATLLRKTLHLRKSPLGVQVIARAAEVLRALEGNDQGLSLGQLARQLNLPKSTVQRIVAVLDRENFVIAATPQAGVRLGPALVRIARSMRWGLVDIARPCLEE